MTSSRGRRAPEREGRDSVGDKHYPGVGFAAVGGKANPALHPGDGGGYEYDWENTWPGGTPNLRNITVVDGGVAVTQHSYTHGDLINTHPDYATISLTTNYESVDENGDPVGIASVVFTEDNITIAGTSAVTELRYIRLVVTDLAVPANVRTWTIDASVNAIPASPGVLPAENWTLVDSTVAP